MPTVDPSASLTAYERWMTAVAPVVWTGAGSGLAVVLVGLGAVVFLAAALLVLGLRR